MRGGPAQRLLRPQKPHCTGPARPHVLCARTRSAPDPVAVLVAIMNMMIIW